ncbi:hypothetical protein [Oerskovia sp. USHLN155]
MTTTPDQPDQADQPDTGSPEHESPGVPREAAAPGDASGRAEPPLEARPR